MNDYNEARHHARDLQQQAERASLRHRAVVAAKWERRADRAAIRARDAADRLR